MHSPATAPMPAEVEPAATPLAAPGGETAARAAVAPTDALATDTTMGTAVVASERDPAFEAPTAGTPELPAVATTSVAVTPVPTSAPVATTLQPTAPAFAAPSGGAGSVGGAVAALVLVVALILALAWLARRMPGLGGGTTSGLRLVGSLSLGPRERVAVVEVGGTQLLLGIGGGGIRTLHTLAEPLPERAPAASTFAQLLTQLPGKKP